MKVEFANLIIIVVVQLSLSVGVIGQEEKSNTGADFPCAPDVKLKDFQDRQLELNTLPPPVPPAVAPEFKKWQIVVGRDFNYRATPNNAENWQWTVGNPFGNNHWNFTPSLNGTREGISRIPVENIPVEADYLNFGTTQGQLRVSATVQGTEKHDDRAIKVYFVKDEMNFHQPDEPNWFYYWSKVVEGELTTQGIRLFTVDDNLNAVLNVNPPTPITFTLNYREDGPFSWPQPPNTAITYGVNRLGNQMGLFQFTPIPGGSCDIQLRKLML